MLQSIRNNTQSVFAKLLVGLIVVVFALWGVDAIVGGFNGPQPAATVNGEEIEEIQVQRTVEIRKRELYSRFGESFDPSLIDDGLLRNAAVEELINRSILSSDARDQGLSFSDQALDQMIVNAPSFQVDGKFSEDAFDAAIRSLGYTRVGFREMAREDMMVGQIRGGLAATSFITEREAKQVSELEQQRRDYAFTTITRSAMEETIELTEDEVSEYYEENSQEYRTEEQVKIEYIALSIDDFTNKVEITEEDLTALYNETIADMEVTEERKASHILLTLDESLTEQAAIEKLTSVKTKVQNGESFADLAKELSDDPGSAQQGGDLGFAGKGTYVEAFEDALFSMAEGDMSEPVVTQFGVHLIQLNAIRTQDIPTFDELKPRLEQDLRLAEAKTDFVEAGEELANAAYSSDSLEEAAQELSLSLVSSELFTRDGGSDQITSNPQIIAQVFAQDFIEKGQSSELIELSDEQSVVVRVVDHVLPETRPLEEVKEQVTEALKTKQAQVKARDLADALLNHLRAGNELDQFEGKAGLSWSAIEKAGRTEASVNTAINNKAFTLGWTSEAKSFDREILANGDVVVIRLDAVTQAEAIDEQDLDTTQQMLANQAARSEYQAYQNSLRERAEIIR